ncbi:lysophospholipid acyltransferase family protein [Antrihabitans cavernicola]|uniref:1-acyl-sn-glycerol-3-phosphate acyltransferase n=1 Tax=Antrihabitans cavernicola TaxID=2495913 RepID=A0A5A7SH67_9NOCA|nr:lysophospholipid acyltransferase family protein [Spelaeibacter cavernicola]KAA0023835.1 1-acyl-sn-glycerol-3-phosphate acyltransferase [Spelaeibacter cavernicola]
MLYPLLKYVLIGPVLWVLGRPTVEGAQHIPSSGPVILAGNHLTFVDSLYLPLVVRRRITFVAKSEYFTGTGIRGALNRWFYKAVGQVPIDRSGGDGATGALSAATRILAAGGIWGIYPEGTRSPDGRLYKGKTGVMRVALATGAPVIPVVISGTESVNPRGRRGWRLGRVHIAFCEPLDLSRYRELAMHRAVVRSATDQLMRELQRKSGQEYVDSYANRYRTESASDS